MNDMSETCSLCNKPNDQMLMLSCIHDPCINCAATAYAEQVHIKGQNKEVYICEICGEQTLLDNSTVLELSALASSVIKMPSRAPHKQVNTTTRLPKKEVQQGATANVPANKKIVYYCKDHSEEEISYYCFSCWVTICPECAIHGSHKDHEVKLIKKAISQVKTQYLDITSRTSEAQAHMTKLKDGFLRMIKDTNERHSRQKHSISREFDLLRAALASKEKDLIRQLDEANKQNLAALTQYLQVINVNYEEANKSKRTIETITKKDDVLILEDYRKIGDLQETLNQLSKTSESINGEAAHLNVQFLQQQLKQVSERVGEVQVNLRKEEVSGKTVIGGVSGSPRPHPPP